MASSGPDRVDAAAVCQAVIDRYLAACAVRDAAGCAALHGAEGAVQSPVGPPAKGQAEIAAVHRDLFKDGETNKAMRLTRAGIDGDPGYCLIQFEAVGPGADGGTIRFRGTSLNVMQRRTDGIWTIALTSLNESLEQAMESDR